MSRSMLSGALVLLLAGCAAAEAPAPAPTPAAVAEEIGAEPVVVAAPEIPVAERIRAPFAVQSSGRPTAHRPRTAVVLDTLTPPPAPRRTAAAEVEPDTVAAVEESEAERTSTAAQVAEERAPRAEPAPAEPRASPAPAEAAGERRADQPPAPAAAGRPQPREHRVASGETFMGIARRYAVSYTALLNANPGLDPDRLRPDQVIRIPAAATATAAPAAPAARPAGPVRPAGTHTVAQGETLWSIARRYGVSPEQLRTANRLQDDTIRIGQTLVIPNS